MHFTVEPSLTMISLNSSADSWHQPSDGNLWHMDPFIFWGSTYSHKRIVLPPLIHFHVWTMRILIDWFNFIKLTTSPNHPRSNVRWGPINGDLGMCLLGGNLSGRIDGTVYGWRLIYYRSKLLSSIENQCLPVLVSLSSGLSNLRCCWWSGAPLGQSI